MQPSGLALLTDLYELTMAASYLEEGMEGRPATFDLFVRELPRERNFLIAAGLEDALAYLESLRFEPDDLAYLRSLGMFGEPFIEYLARFRFTGEVWAMPEGEAAFAEEPLLRVTAPLIEAQVVETYLLNCINFQTMVASKAARVALACEGRPFADFSGRRDHAGQAAVKVARASYIGGASSTSNVLAGKRYGLPLSGTMAHSYVMSFPDEYQAFRAYARAFPSSATLLIDTYDTPRGARIAVEVARELASEGVRIRGVRIDSGDLPEMARAVRSILDEGGCPEVRIFVSGDLDERRIAAMVKAGAPIDAFGVGTQLGTSADAPYLGGVYKLVEDEAGPKVKLSVGKRTIPGRKQVYRLERNGRAERDIIALEDEPAPPGSRPLLAQVMSGGHRTAAPELLETMRGRCTAAVASLPAELRELDRSARGYPVELSPALQALLERAQKDHR